MIHAHRSQSTSLASPIQGLMDGRIDESMTAQLQIRLLEKKTGKLLIEDVGVHAGLEVAGAVDQIITR